MARRPDDPAGRSDQRGDRSPLWARRTAAPARKAVGALKRSLTPMAGELGIHVCGGRGAHSRRTSHELTAIGEQVGFDGATVGTASDATPDDRIADDRHDVVSVGGGLRLVGTSTPPVRTTLWSRLRPFRGNRGPTSLESVVGRDGESHVQDIPINHCRCDLRYADLSGCLCTG